jgi:hypothetical protein
MYLMDHFHRFNAIQGKTQQYCEDILIETKSAFIEYIYQYVFET